jgi:hypothetical protein
MIKKFKTFINESINIKTEYQIHHYNNIQKTEYFTKRLEDFSKNGSYSFKNYEWDLCPSKILKEYIKICAETGDGLTDYMLADIKDDNFKTLYIIHTNLENLGLPNDMFNKLSEELKNYYINKKIETSIDDFFYTGHSDLTDEEFNWCSEELKLKYMNYKLEDSVIEHEKIDCLSDKVFEWCSDDLRIKYINKLINAEASIDIEKFKMCSDKLKKHYINKVIKNINFLDDYLFDLCSDDLKKYYIEKVFDDIKNSDGRLSIYQSKWYETHIKDK